MTQTIALLGHPVSHSISPVFQQAALDALRIDARYEAWDTPPLELQSAIERLRSRDVLGANVTVPHKVDVMRLIDQPDSLVEFVGAVNTIVNRDGKLHATNTDITGILAALAEVKSELAGVNVVVLGAGGAARAVVVAMRRAGAARVTVANRTPARAEALIALGGSDFDVRTCPLDLESERLRVAVAAARVIVQTTSLGMRHGPDEAATPLPSRMFHQGQLAFDLVYTPERTPFLAAAEHAGAQTLGGLAMLVHQGAAAFQLWTGREPPLAVMFEAARAALDASATAPETGMR
ncbi:MAG: shikimate dehydrogenase [Chloroflexi bacterium]|nr:shikimate dehydrogenase [Chloroflexota bacterium]MDA1146487.1 shikimate dehydrogenase [Chloroflexota bacterium]PKB56659.1 MAG: shikimate dehydrogenase [SAR202 cluster bacterium Casp-Chloro-G1]